MGRVLCPSFFNIRSTRSLTLVVCRRRTTQLRKTECLVWSGQHQIKQSQNKPLSYIQDGQCKFALEKGVAECIKKKKHSLALVSIFHAPLNIKCKELQNTHRWL